jgi:hypothetical protein
VLLRSSSFLKEMSILKDSLYGQRASNGWPGAFFSTYLLNNMNQKNDRTYSFCHPRVGGDPVALAESRWVPAFAGMTPAVFNQFSPPPLTPESVTAS